VDPRRQNLSEESLKVNVERLQDYMKRVIVFPRKSSKTKKGDASEADVKAAKSGEGIITSMSEGLPIKNIVKVPEVELSGEKSTTEDTYKFLRSARSDARYIGAREKRAKQKADEAAAAKK